ncbi:MAG TPA: hypothetical protein VFZ67_05140 [Nitrososphaera sp.]
MPVTSILSSVLFAACLFFYLYVVGSFFKITVYPLIDRVTFYVFFQEHIINEYLDNIIVIVAATLWFLLSINNKAIRYYFPIIYGSAGIILAIISPEDIISDIVALLSLPLIIGVMLYHHKLQKDALNFNVKLTLQYVSITVIAISVMGIVFSLLDAFVTLDFALIARDSYANEFFLLLSSFSSFYIVLLVFCLPVKVLFRGAVRMLKLDIEEENISQSLSNSHEQNKLKTQTKIGFLLLAMVLSIVLALIPQHPSINPDNQDIGVDTDYYVTWVGELAKSKSVSDLIYQAFIVQGQDGDRPLSLIFFFLVYQVAGGSGNLSEVIEHLPIILGPGIVLAFYFLTLELTRSEKIALIAAFLGAVSFHTLIGIYAGLYANWLALIVGYISVVFLFRYLRSGRPFDIVVFSILLIGVLFIHVYTWTVLAAVAGIFLFTMLVIQNKKRIKKSEDNNNNNNYFTQRRIIWLLLFAILPSIVVDLTKVLLTGSSGGIEQDIEVAQRALGIEQFNLRWEILTTTMHHSLGGVFSNFIILILGLFWVLKSNMREPATIFLMIFLSAGLVPLFVGNWSIQSRVFYDMPIEIPAAIALYYISKRLDSMLVPLAGCTWLVAISLLTVTNYHLIPVPGMR